jgi:DNA-binding IscR family transcriptional regulator
MTPTQLSVLDYCRERLTSSGISPTLQEIGDHCGVSRPRVAQIVDRLAQDGLLKRTRGRHRGIALGGMADIRAIATAAILAELGRRGETLDGLARPARPMLGRGTVTCAADCCSSSVQRGHLYCRSHWFSLPLALTQRLKVAFGAGDQIAYQEAFFEAQSRIDGSWRSE